MSGPHEKLARLRRYNAAVQQKDPKIAEESRDTGELEVFAEAPSPEAVENQIELLIHRHDCAACQDHIYALHCAPRF